MSGKNHYEALGVEKNSSQDEIRKAYRKLAVQHHPDKGGNENRFKEISEAYDVLGAPQKKQEYDRSHNPHTFHNRGPQQMNNPFDTFFSMNNFFNHPQRSNPQNEPRKQFHQKLDITLTEAFTGCKKRIDINCEEECECYTKTVCTNCKGKKTVEQTVVRQMGNTKFVQSATVICSSCSGSGFIKKKTNENTCSLCNGSFIKKSVSTLEVRLEAKTFNDFTTKIPYPKNKNNDLHINVHIIFPPFFSKENNDLIYTKEITLFQVLLGVEFEIDHPSGKKIPVNYKNREEIIRPETSITFPGEGVGVNSNLIVKFKIKFPKRKSAKLSKTDDDIFKEQISELFEKYFNLC
jgi:DnaJ-class molecular chaperone